MRRSLGPQGASCLPMSPRTLQRRLPADVVAEWTAQASEKQTSVAPSTPSTGLSSLAGSDAAFSIRSKLANEYHKEALKVGHVGGTATDSLMCQRDARQTMKASPLPSNETCGLVMAGKDVQEYRKPQGRRCHQTVESGSNILAHEYSGRLSPRSGLPESSTALFCNWFPKRSIQTADVIGTTPRAQSSLTKAGANMTLRPSSVQVLKLAGEFPGCGARDSSLNMWSARGSSRSVTSDARVCRTPR